MSDIAKKMGISTVSVSKALSGKEGVSDSVRENIIKVAQEMGYKYVTSSREMACGVHNNIGVIVPERFFSENAFYSDLYQRVVKAFDKKGISCILEIISRQNEKECVMPNMMVNDKIDGLVVLGQMYPEYIDALADSTVPYIFLDFYNDKNAVDSVVGDSVYGSYLLTNYLISNGYTRIGFVGDIYATSSILDRYMGYYKAMIEHKLDAPKSWLISDRNDVGDYIKMELPEDMPDAFVCNCDEAAYYFINQLKQAGYAVPDDISVVGFDDYIYAKLCFPMLTTFRIDLEMMSEVACDAITRKVCDPDYRIGRKVICGDLVIRDSVKERMDGADGKSKNKK